MSIDRRDSGRQVQRGIERNPSTWSSAPIAAKMFPNTSFSFSNTTLTVLTAIDPTLMTARLRQEIRAIDPALPIVRITRMREQVERLLGQEKVAASAGERLRPPRRWPCLSGLYGVMAYSRPSRDVESSVFDSRRARHRPSVAWTVIRESLIAAVLSGAGSWSGRRPVDRPNSRVEAFRRDDDRSGDARGRGGADARERAWWRL